MLDIINEQQLYITDNTGALRLWGISAEECPDGSWQINIIHGQFGGSLQEKHELVTEGKQSRTIKEQVLLQMASRISKQRDKGYTKSVKEAREKKATNQLNLPKPMLAQPAKNVKIIGSNPIVQCKYDGHRCLVHFHENGSRIAYSRNGKPITTIGNILNELGNTEVPVGATLDGELYYHGVPLQRIASWVKRAQLDTEKLVYMIYDIIEPNDPRAYISRLERLKKYLYPSTYKPLKFNLVESRPLLEGDSDSVKRLFKMARLDGYEGLIIRHGGTPYEDGKRSNSLVKVKGWEDDEFYIYDIVTSKDGWAILRCETNSAIPKRFSVSAPGTIDEKTKILKDREQYIGRMVRVEFANYTKDGVPFHPVAIAFRDKTLE